MTKCPRCQIEAKLKKRPFSESAIAALVAWGELAEEIADEPICSDCYNELRETLMDRQSEFSDQSSMTRAS